MNWSKVKRVAMKAENIGAKINQYTRDEWCIICLTKAGIVGHKKRHIGRILTNTNQYYAENNLT